MFVVEPSNVRWWRAEATFRFPIRAVCTYGTTEGRGGRMVGGREVTPKDAANTEKLMRYWAEGEGAAKIQWDTPGDFSRCVTELSRHVSPAIVKGLCSNLHQRATGARPGHAAGETDGHGHQH